MSASSKHQQTSTINQQSVDENIPEKQSSVAVSIEERRKQLAINSETIRHINRDDVSSRQTSSSSS